MKLGYIDESSVARGITPPDSHRGKVLPELISLTPEAVAEEITEWFTEKLAHDGRSYGVMGRLDGGRVLAFLKGGDVLVIDVSVGEVVPR